jgi:uncharacterized protein
MASTVFVTGATGFVGQALVRALRDRGDRVVALSRDVDRARRHLGEPDATLTLIAGDPTAPGPWQERLADCAAVIHLAGESIAGRRWNAHYRQRLLDSRVDSTRFVVEGLARVPAAARPAVLLSASGVDYYPFAIDLLGAGDEDRFDETGPRGEGFLSRLCRDWEHEAFGARELGLRVAVLRTGLVLGRGGGALERITLPFRLFVGGPVGSGKQWMSWVHLADVVGSYLFVFDTPHLSGPVNVVAPGAVRQRELARAIGRTLHRPSWLPVPAPALRLAVGPVAEYLLHGRRVVPAALEAAGYRFCYPDLAPALSDLFGSTASRDQSRDRISAPVG